MLKLLALLSVLLLARLINGQAVVTEVPTVSTGSVPFQAIADPVYSICRTNNFVGSTGGDNDNNNNEDENDFVLTAFSPVIVAAGGYVVSFNQNPNQAENCSLLMFFALPCNQITQATVHIPTQLIGSTCTAQWALYQNSTGSNSNNNNNQCQLRLTLSGVYSNDSNNVNIGSGELLVPLGQSIVMDAFFNTGTTTPTSNNNNNNGVVSNVLGCGGSGVTDNTTFFSFAVDPTQLSGVFSQGLSSASMLELSIAATLVSIAAVFLALA